jgi:flagellar protein FlgJ
MEGLSLDPRLLYNNVKMKMDKSSSDANGFDKVLQATIDKTQKKQELKKACTAMESLFIDQMLKVMRKSVNKNNFLNGGFAEEVFEDMLYTEYSQKMAESGHFGVAKMLYQSMERYI